MPIKYLFLLIFTVSFTSAQTPLRPLSDAPQADDAMRRSQWEIQRLADPATGKIPAGIRMEELEFAVHLPKASPAAVNARALSPVSGRGPVNVGGRTRALAIDVTDENILFAGSVNGGMWRSADGGLTWNRVSPIGQNPAITDVAQDTRSGRTDTWYFSTGEGYGTSASATGAFYLGNGIYKSTDGGLTWSVLASTSSGTPHTFDNVWDMVWRVATDPSITAQDVVYAATYGAIMRSVNGGTSWTVDKGNASGSSFSYFTDVAVTSTGIAYAVLSSDGPSKGIWRRDPVSGWAAITPSDLDTAVYDRIVIGINPSNENEVWFLGQTPYHGKRTTNYKGTEEWNSLLKYTYISGNGTGAGGSWSDRSAHLPQDGSQLGNFNAQGGYNLLVRVHPNDSNIIFIGGTNLYRSTDGFTSDTNVTLIGGYNPAYGIPFYVNYLNHHSDQHNLAFYPSNPNRMIQSNDGGVVRTANNLDSVVVWEDINSTYVTAQFYTVALDHGTPGNDIIIGGMQDNGTWFTNTQDASVPWTHPGWGDGGYCAIDNGHQNYYMSRQEGKVARMTLDAAGNVTAFRRIDPIGPVEDDYLFISPLTLDPNNTNRMYLPAGNKLWRNDSLDIIPLTGQWDTISTGWFQMPDTADSKITAITVCTTPANRVYYGLANKKVFRLDNANTSTPTLTNITGNAVFPTTANVNSIAVDPNNGDHLLVAFSNYRVYSIYASSDAGATWTKVAGNLESTSLGNGAGPSVRWVSIVPTASGNVYLAGTSTGLYGTNTLNGLNTIWTNLSPDEVGYMVVDMMDARASDGRVAIATHGGGMYSMQITDTIFTSATVIDPLSLQVSAYPNPTAGRFTVSFTLQTPQEVTVILMDQNGRTVEVADRTFRGIGDHQVVCSKELAAGTYLVKVEGTRTGVSVRKLIVR